MGPNSGGLPAPEPIEAPDPLVGFRDATSRPIINGHISLDSVDFFGITVMHHLICHQCPYL